jgi:hypothetical protein
VGGWSNIRLFAAFTSASSSTIVDAVADDVGVSESDVPPSSSHGIGGLSCDCDVASIGGASYPRLNFGPGMDPVRISWRSPAHSCSVGANATWARTSDGKSPSEIRILTTLSALTIL